MNISLPLFGVFGAVVLLLAQRAPKHLFFFWPILLLVFPTTRTMVGPAPIYWYDVVIVALLYAMYLNRAHRIRWPKGLARWHWWFIGTAFVGGLVVPTIRYGFSAEMVWILGHASLSWMAFPLGIALFTSARAEQNRQNFLQGLLVSLGATAGVALLQFGDPAMAARINSFYFGDVEGSIRLAEFAAYQSASRVSGPYGGPNGFGGITAVVCAVALLLYHGHAKRLPYVVGTLGTIVIAATVSRQVLAAAIFAAGAALFYMRIKGKIKLVAIAAMILTGALVSGVATNWSERLNRVEGGIEEDMNIYGRLVIGPTRMWEVIERDPTVLLFGVGLDVQKLVTKGGRGEDVGFYKAGFVSNSFLLPLYYLGIVGFAVMIVFWTRLLQRATRLPRDIRPLGIGCTIGAMILIASDNWAFLKEPGVCMLFVFGGCVYGILHQAIMASTMGSEEACIVPISKANAKVENHNRRV